MIIMGIVAWLGNQMFQYAHGKKLSIQSKQPLYLDIDPMYYDMRNYELGIYNIEENFATEKQKRRYTKLRKKKFLDTCWYPVKRFSKKFDPHYIIENKKHPKIHKSMFDYRNDIQPASWDYYLEWFWQSEKYFIDIAPIIRKEFTLEQPITDPKNVDIMEKIHNSNAISLHVRRTDYMWSDFSWVATIEYYNRAIQYIQQKVINPTFFIFSDDPVWTKENIMTNHESYFIDWNTKENSYKDMQLMSLCKHNIIANSSFSWRWARLNNNADKIVIAPAKWHQKLDYKDIIPSSRVRL